MNSKNFFRYAKFVLGYTILVILWGAFVRATGSGAGCGAHWPMCQGEVIPHSPSLKTFIEFSHRLSSGLSLIFVAYLWWWARKIFSQGNLTRRAAGYSLIFILGEALVGAALVLLSLVENDTSVMRAVVIALHLVNTFVLLYWLTYTCEQNEKRTNTSLTRWDFTKESPRLWIFVGMVLVVCTGAMGAIVALGDTLFPSKSIAAGISADFSSASHFLIRLRFIHPLLAVVTTLYLFSQAFSLPRRFKSVISPDRAKYVAYLVVVQLLFGTANLFMLAPIWMQLGHLLLADLLWIALVRVYIEGANKVTS